MNCPKCNSPLADGDKFCKVCGSSVVMNNEGVNANMQNNVNNQPMQQQYYNNVPPVNNNTGGNKNNTMMYVLIGVIAVLVIVIIVLFISGTFSSSNDNESTGGGTTNNSSSSDNSNAGVSGVSATKTTNTVTVAGYTMELPSGYSVEYYGGSPWYYNSDQTVFGAVELATGITISSLKQYAETMKLELQNENISNVSYTTVTVNGKSGLVFSGEYSGYYVDYFYFEYDSVSVMYGAAMYETTSLRSSEQSKIEEMVAGTVVSSSAYNSNISIPTIDLNKILSN